jgi:hypothetical protein
MARTGPYHKLRLEPLESRFVADAGLAWDTFFQTPVSETAHSATHTQPHLSILTDSQTHAVPAETGIQANGKAMPIHSQDATGRLHVDSPILHDSHLQEFIKIWTQLLRAPQVIGAHADAAHTITKTVGGQPGTASGALTPRARQEIEPKVDTLKTTPLSGPDPSSVSLALADRSDPFGSATQASFIPNVSGFSAIGTLPHAAAWSAPLPAPRLDASRHSLSGSDSTLNPKEPAESMETSAIDRDLDRISRRLAPDAREDAKTVDQTGPDSTLGQEPRTELPKGPTNSDETENPGS